uniref:EF-hand calcium-binding domain-containing protein 14 isoform X3 n=1 Tax=Myxine glutinosa TaxID=7769 RepID=UPI00358E5C78
MNGRNVPEVREKRNEGVKVNRESWFWQFNHKRVTGRSCATCRNIWGTENRELGEQGRRGVGRRQKDHLPTCLRWGCRHGMQACRPLGIFVAVAAIVVALGTLLCLQLELREEGRVLAGRLLQVENAHVGIPPELVRLSERLGLLQKDSEHSALDNHAMRANISRSSSKVSALSKELMELKVSVTAAADLLSVPATLKELRKSVASLGSSITSVQHDIQTLQEMTNPTAPSIPLASEKAVNPTLPPGLLQLVEQLNATLGPDWPAHLINLVTLVTAHGEAASSSSSPTDQLQRNLSAVNSTQVT